MKKIFLLLISLMMMIPTIASAHTELKSSNPRANQVINKDIKEIVLTFEGKIESLSTLDLIKDGQKISNVRVTPKDNQLIGTLSEPLENGSYTIRWSIAGEDGHAIKGEIPFKVEKEVTLDKKVENKESVAVEKEEPKKESTTQQQTNQQSTDSANKKNIITVVIVVIVVILILGVFLLFRRKR